MDWEWQERYILGHEPMDATHREFITRVKALAESGNETALAELERLIAHTQAHFAQENRWMEESAFPPLHCHVGEHQRVLASMASVLSMAKKSSPALGRKMAVDLPAWFENHAATMDAALAQHMRHVGYVPVNLETLAA
jgi:hemerythrin-like metal-binding protein